MIIKSSYVLDAMNLFSILTGHPFYTEHHREIADYWSRRLSSANRAALQRAQEHLETHMLGPRLSLLISALPDFEAHNSANILSEPERIHTFFKETPYYIEDTWPNTEQACHALAPVAQELEEQGLADYWQRERLPLTEAKQQELAVIVDADLTQAVQRWLGPDQAPTEITLYLCTFAAPHGMKITGPRFVTDVRYDAGTILRIAVHEMFHPPYAVAEVEPELQALIQDPLFQDCFAATDPIYGYTTELGFLEENVVEACTYVVCKQLGLEGDYLERLKKREGGVYKLTLVLIKFFEQTPKDPEESFTNYFKRIIAALPLGRLDQDLN